MCKRVSPAFFQSNLTGAIETGARLTDIKAGGVAMDRGARDSYLLHVCMYSYR